jgi:thioredoxin reductase
VKPHELRRIAREELRDYPSVEIRDGVTVEDVTFLQGTGFEVLLQGGMKECTRKLLLATGVDDNLPDIPGFADLYGHGVYNCPYCDGWEERDRPLAVYGKNDKGKHFALQLTIWTRDIVLCTDGPSDLTTDDRARLERHGVVIREDRVTRLEGDDDRLNMIHFDEGPPLPREGLFFITGAKPDCALATKLGCQLTEKGYVITVGNEETNVPGLFVAGDASQRVQFAVVAAAEGALAAFEINSELIEEDLG